VGLPSSLGQLARPRGEQERERKQLASFGARELASFGARELASFGTRGLKL